MKNYWYLKSLIAFVVICYPLGVYSYASCEQKMLDNLTQDEAEKEFQTLSKRFGKLPAMFIQSFDIQPEAYQFMYDQVGHVGARFLLGSGNGKWLERYKTLLREYEHDHQRVLSAILYEVPKDAGLYGHYSDAYVWAYARMYH